MPQSQTTSQSQTSSPNGDYTAVDPRKDSLSFVYQNRTALSRMDPDKAVKFADMMFRRYALPKYQKMNQQRPLDEDEVERLRLQFAARLFDIPFDQETKLKDVKPEHGVLEKGAALAAAGGAGVIGGLRTIEELRESIQKHLGPVGKALQYDPINILAKKTLGSEGPASKIEGKAYSEAKEVTPRGADIAAGIGHQIPASIATSGVGSILPSMGKAAPLAAKVVTGAGRGVAEGATFEASRPGGDPASGIKWGGVLGAAFPMLGRLFGLGRTEVSSTAPEVAKAVGGEEAPAARAASSEATPKSLGDVAEKAAKDKFGKSFKDLTSAEKVQMPQFMKEEVARQRVQQAATKKAEVAAAKAGKEADAVAKRAEKANIASQKAASQAAKRSETGVSSSVAKQAVAAQAASENPSIAKVMGAVEGGETEAEHAIRTRGQKTPTPVESPVIEEKRGMPAGPLKQPDVTKIPAGETGPKIRAKGGQPASPAQQAADRERIAAKRAKAKQTEFGSTLEKHAQELVGKHTSLTQVGIQHIPELEGAIKELPNGEVVLRGLQKLRKAGRITDEIYAEEIKNWMLTQFEAQP